MPETEETPVLAPASGGPRAFSVGGRDAARGKAVGVGAPQVAEEVNPRRVVRLSAGVKFWLAKRPIE
jgi:hypothetical protein